jgi:hypothetical protein
MSVARTLTGAFRATRLAADSWRLTTGMDGAPEIYLCGVPPAAAAALADAAPDAVSVTWSAAGAVITLISSAARLQVAARAATLHEPRPQLYQGLPLVRLDNAARRFWRRIFFLARMPGGRRLLRWIAQRGRGG